MVVPLDHPCLRDFPLDIIHFHGILRYKPSGYWATWLPPKKAEVTPAMPLCNGLAPGHPHQRFAMESACSVGSLATETWPGWCGGVYCIEVQLAPLGTQESISYVQLKLGYPMLPGYL